MLLNFFDAATTCAGLFGLTTRLDSLRALLTSLSCVTWMLATFPPGFSVWMRHDWRLDERPPRLASRERACSDGSSEECAGGHPLQSAAVLVGIHVEGGLEPVRHDERDDREDRADDRERTLKPEASRVPPSKQDAVSASPQQRAGPSHPSSPFVAEPRSSHTTTDRSTILERSPEGASTSSRSSSSGSRSAFTPPMRKARRMRAFEVAGAGFEPATSGL